MPTNPAQNPTNPQALKPMCTEIQTLNPRSAPRDNRVEASSACLAETIRRRPLGQALPPETSQTPMLLTSFPARCVSPVLPLAAPLSPIIVSFCSPRSTLRQPSPSPSALLLRVHPCIPLQSLASLRTAPRLLPLLLHPPHLQYCPDSDPTCTYLNFSSELGLSLKQRSNISIYIPRLRRILSQ